MYTKILKIVNNRVIIFHSYVNKQNKQFLQYNNKNIKTLFKLKQNATIKSQLKQQTNDVIKKIKNASTINELLLYDNYFEKQNNYKINFMDKLLRFYEKQKSKQIETYMKNYANRLRKSHNEHLFNKDEFVTVIKFLLQINVSEKDNRAQGFERRLLLVYQSLLPYLSLDEAITYYYILAQLTPSNLFYKLDFCKYLAKSLKNDIITLAQMILLLEQFVSHKNHIIVDYNIIQKIMQSIKIKSLIENKSQVQIVQLTSCLLQISSYALGSLDYSYYLSIVTYTIAKVQKSLLQNYPAKISTYIVKLTQALQFNLNNCLFPKTIIRSSLVRFTNYIISAVTNSIQTIPLTSLLTLMSCDHVLKALIKQGWSKVCQYLNKSQFIINYKLLDALHSLLEESSCNYLQPVHMLLPYFTKNIFDWSCIFFVARISQSFPTLIFQQLNIVASNNQEFQQRIISLSLINNLLQHPKIQSNTTIMLQNLKNEHEKYILENGSKKQKLWHDILTALLQTRTLTMHNQLITFLFLNYNVINFQFMSSRSTDSESAVLKLYFIFRQIYQKCPNPCLPLQETPEQYPYHSAIMKNCKPNSQKSFQILTSMNVRQLISDSNSKLTSFQHPHSTFRIDILQKLGNNQFSNFQFLLFETILNAYLRHPHPRSFIHLIEKCDARGRLEMASQIMRLLIEGVVFGTLKECTAAATHITKILLCALPDKKQYWKKLIFIIQSAITLAVRDPEVIQGFCNWIETNLFEAKGKIKMFPLRALFTLRSQEWKIKIKQEQNIGAPDFKETALLLTDNVSKIKHLYILEAIKKITYRHQLLLIYSMFQEVSLTDQSFALQFRSIVGEKIHQLVQNQVFRREQGQEMYSRFGCKY